MRIINLVLAVTTILYGGQILTAMNQQNINVLYYPSDIPEPLAAEMQNSYGCFTHNDSQVLWIGAQNITKEVVAGCDYKYISIFSSNIGKNTFSGMVNLEFVQITSDQPISIDEYAFANCPNLKLIEIRGKLQNISCKTFYTSNNMILCSADSRFIIFSRPTVDTFNLAKNLPAWYSNLEWRYNDGSGDFFITFNTLLQLRENARLYNSFHLE